MTGQMVTSTPRTLLKQSRTFNGFLDINDPSEFLGVELSNFAISISYPVPPEFRGKLKDIQQEFYSEIFRKISEESLGNTSCQILDYSDLKVRNEDPRRYLKIEYSTARNTQVTSLARCLINGDTLYISLDSYVLGELKIAPLVIQGVIAVAALSVSLIFPPLFILVAIYQFFN